MKHASSSRFDGHPKQISLFPDVTFVCDDAPLSEPWLRQIIDFFNASPKVNRKAHCVQFLDWNFDFDCKPMTVYAASFYTLIRKDLSGLIYTKIGVYNHCDDLNVKTHIGADGLGIVYEKTCTEHLFYLPQYSQQRGAGQYLRLSSEPPFSRGFAGCTAIYDLTTQRDDFPEWCLFDHPPDKYKIQVAKIKQVLKDRSATIFKTAVDRNYKSGWVYHQLNNPVREIQEIWRSHNFYCDISCFARLLVLDFKKQFRPHEYQDWLISCEDRFS